MTLSKNTKSRICRVASFIPDKPYLYLMYYLHTGRLLHLNNPSTFNEKLQWLKLYDRNPLYSDLVDKYLVRSYVSAKIGEQYLIPLIGVWDSTDDISIDDLPNQFVIKCTHDSGSIVICKSKSQFDFERAKKSLNQSLNANMYYNAREWPYKKVKPRIIAEKYMEDSQTKELRDYKFFCFNGKVRMFKIDFDRFNEHGANYYNIDKELLPFDEIVCPRKEEKRIIIPDSIDKMMALAEQLVNAIPFARVDFYEVDGQIYFGEITFFPASGFGTFDPLEWDYIIGNWLELPQGGR